jgi:hypothetical protein
MDAMGVGGGEMATVKRQLTLASAFILVLAAAVLARVAWISHAPRSSPSMGTNAGVNIDHDEFRFSLSGDWVQVASLDPEQFSFESKEKRTSVVLSVERLDIPHDKLVEVAQKMADLREQGERAARQEEKIVFGDKWVELSSSGDVAEVAYAGCASRGTIFRFFGFVTQRKVLSLWVSTSTTDNDFSKAVFEEVFGGLKYYVP